MLPQNLGALTSLRFFAAFWVLTFHFRSELPFDIDRYTHLFAQGTIAVDFFFCLSGFILAHVYHDEVVAGRFSPVPFLQRRLARLYPLHIATLLLAILIGLTMSRHEMVPGGKYDPDLLPANLLLLHAWGVTDRVGFNVPSWSISAEWFAYLCFPFLIVRLAMGRLGGVGWTVIGGAMLVVLWWVAPLLTGRPLTIITFDLGIMRLAPSFVLGMAAYRLSRDGYQPVAMALPLLVVAGTAMLVGAHLGVPGVLLLPLCPVLVLAGAGLSAAGSRVLHGPGWVYLGEISYAVYMLHAMLWNGWYRAWSKILGADIHQTAATLGVMASGVLLILACSAAAYHVVELPCRRLLAPKGRPLRRPEPAPI